MITIAKELCVYCLDKSVLYRTTSKYEVGLCLIHKDILDSEIHEILGEVKPRKRGVNTLLK